jgi:hypothetical protein
METPHYQKKEPSWARKAMSEVGDKVTPPDTPYECSSRKRSAMKRQIRETRHGPPRRRRERVRV